MTRDHAAALDPDPIGPTAGDPPAGTGSAERVAAGEPPRGSRYAWRAVAGLLVLLVPATLALVAWELHTSTLQSRWFSGYASRLSWDVRPGAAPAALQAPNGPYDDRHGYSRLADIQARLEKADFRVVRQANPTYDLQALASKGIAPPYREKNDPRLEILDARGRSLYTARPQQNLFREFVDVPPLVVKSLLYVENRQLLDDNRSELNPALDWDRLVISSWRYALDRFLGTGNLSGGSTLATQVQKFRHSENGRTNGLGDKMRQMLGASLAAYHEGTDTRAARGRVVVDYLNGLPLGAAKVVGEVTGLGDGMWVYFGKTLEELTVDLSLPEEGVALEQKAQTYKQALSLLLATRRPRLYLGPERDALERRLDFYLGELAREGVISPTLEAAARHAPLGLRSEPPKVPSGHYAERKAANAIRTELMGLLGMRDYYQLDRMDMRVETTIDGTVQADVLSVMQQLRDPSFLGKNGFFGEHLLGDGDPSLVNYTFTMYESDPSGNHLRVQADNLDRPFDLNEGAKLELGSTAKLRTTAHYLEVIADLYARHAGTPANELLQVERQALDPITRWAAGWLAVYPHAALEQMLEASLDRVYSANPNATFYTGGGVHTFANFDDKFEGDMPLRLGFRHSVNLVFIRLMRDLVQYHVAELGYDERAILSNPNHPDRKRLLKEAVDRESRQHLWDAYGKYRHTGAEAAVRELCGNDERTLDRFAIFYLGGKPGSSQSELQQAAMRLFPERAAEIEARAERLYTSFGRLELNLNDQAWLLRRDPMDIWLVRDLLTHPGAGWTDIVERSAGARIEAHTWLLEGRVWKAQNLRINMQLERLAFEQIHKAWQQVGYPFAQLVPSLATAIGSSADRPSALAELVGILQNDGLRAPTVRIRTIHFAEGTPYETHFEFAPEPTERVMNVEVARTVKRLLVDVVENGTAQRVRGTLKLPGGQDIAIGGKTGSGDNRYERFTAQGGLISSKPINRTASFVFVVGQRHYGVITATVDGEKAGDFSFTSSLALQSFKTLAPAIEPLIAGDVQAAELRSPNATTTWPLPSVRAAMPGLADPTSDASVTASVTVAPSPASDQKAEEVQVHAREAPTPATESQAEAMHAATTEPQTQAAQPVTTEPQTQAAHTARRDEHVEAAPRASKGRAPSAQTQPADPKRSTAPSGADAHAASPPAEVLPASLDFSTLVELLPTIPTRLLIPASSTTRAATRTNVTQQVRAVP